MSGSGKEPIESISPTRDAEAVRTMAEAMADPFRARLLAAISEKPGITIRQTARWVGETDRKVRYHFETLVEKGLIEVQGEVRRRGTMERQYRLTKPIVIETADEQWVSDVNSRRIALEILKLVMADVTSSVSSGRFGTRDGHCESRVRGVVDTQGWDELAALFLRSLGDSQEIIRRSVARREETGEAGVEVTGALFLFEAPIWHDDGS